MIGISNKSRPEFISRPISIILIILLLLLCAMSFIPQVHRWGDTSTYYMQIQSIAEDHDIQYQPNDIERAIETKFDDLPRGLYLIKNKYGNYYYGKDYSYALFAAPFYKLFGNSGILLFNSLMFYAMILMGYLYLRKYNDDLKALFVSVAFFVISTAFVYNFWIHPEIYNMFLITLGLFLWVIYISDDDGRYLVVASIVIGVAAVAKIPNIVLFMPLVLYELYKHRFKNFILMIFTISTVVFMFYGYFYLETGAPSFYGGNRFYYISEYPFLNGYDSANEAGNPAGWANRLFSINKKQSSPMFIDADNLKSVPYNVFYYFLGRFTGIVWYYPLAIFSLISLLLKFSDAYYIKSNPQKILITIGIILYILFFAIVLGNNYLGGQHAIGNRYFYIYPAFLFLLGAIKHRILIPILFLAMLTVAPIIADPIENSRRPDLHTFSIPYTYLPIEYSQLVNLPLWSHVQRGETYEIYTLRIDKKRVDYLIRTKSEFESFDILLWSYCDDNLIKINANSYLYQAILDRYCAKMLTIDSISPEYSDKRGFIYKISLESAKDADTKLIDKSSLTSDTKLLYGSGWHNIENWGGTHTRWMENNATLIIYSGENRSAELDLQVLSYRQSPRTLEIYINGRMWMLQPDLPNTNFVKVKTPPINLNDDINIITFYVPEGCISPHEATVGNSSDRRCLSLAFQDIRLIKDILIVDEKLSIANLAEGWYGLENWNGTPTRWMADDANLMIYLVENRTMNLSFKVASFCRPRSIEIHVNGRPHVWAEVLSENFIMVNVPMISLNGGANIVRFHIPKGCERPCDKQVPEMNNVDQRCLSVAVQDIRIE